MPEMNFQPLDRRVAKAPVGAFSSLIGQRLEEYRMGENITETAKEALGTFAVAGGDEELRNSIADSLNTDLDVLLDQYNGRYESVAFQRDAKKTILDYAKKMEFPAMKGTLESIAYEDELRREVASNPNLQLYDFKPGAPKATTWTPELGHQSYQTGLEVAQDHLTDAKNHIGKIVANAGDIGNGPSFELLQQEGMKDLWAMSKGSWEGVSKGRAKTRADEVVEQFAQSSQGGHQFLRKYLLENPELKGEAYNEDGSMKDSVRAKIAGYLYTVAKGQTFSRSHTDWSVPAALNRKTETIDPLTGARVTQVDLHNNPLSARMQPLEEENFEGKGLQGELREERNRLNMLFYRAVPPGTKSHLSEEEKERRLKLNNMNESLVDKKGLTSFIQSFIKQDGTWDRESLEEDHLGLPLVYETALADLGVTNEEIVNLDPAMTTFIDDKVLKMYNTKIQSNEVQISKGYTLDKQGVEDWDRNMMGKGKSNFGRLKNSGFIDANGKGLVWEDIIKRHKIDEDDPKAMAAFKESVVLNQNLIPILDNSVSLINIGSQQYRVQSSEAAQAMKAANLSAIGEIARGDKTEGEIVSLSFMGGVSGQFVAHDSWDDNDSYDGTGIAFRIRDPKDPTKFGLIPVNQVIEQYLRFSNFYK